MEAFLKIQHFYLCENVLNILIEKLIGMNGEKEMDKCTFLHGNRSWAKYSMFDKNNTCCQARNIELHRTFNGE